MVQNKIAGMLPTHSMIPSSVIIQNRHAKPNQSARLQYPVALVKEPQEVRPADVFAYMLGTDFVH